MPLKTPADLMQTDPPLPPKDTLPTMYDLPSEDPQEPSLPDVFHYYQPHPLQETFCPPERIFAAEDLNFYYDVHHPLWRKRPDLNANNVNVYAIALNSRGKMPY